MSAKNYPRRYRLEALLHEALSALVAPKIGDDLLTVRGVSLSGDLGVARVFYCLAPGGARAGAQRFLDEQAGDCRRRLARRLNMRRTPKLVFVFDRDGIAADKLRDFLETIAPLPPAAGGG